MQYDIAVVHGDGIGPEVCAAAVAVLRAVPGLTRKLAFAEYPAGADHYRTAGDAFPAATFEGCKAAHAILHGAAGLPGVTYPDGTEAGIDFGLQLRFRLDLYANCRPIKLYPGVVSPLRHFTAGQIDYVILRENTEGMYAARNGGTQLRGEVASDTMLITRKGVERIVRTAFEHARRRQGAPRDGKRRVTLGDKANVLRSYAFFRTVFNEVAAAYPDVETDYAYVDAMTVHLLERPDFYDVIVLSAVLMLRWLGERHADRSLIEAADTVERAVERVLASGAGLTRDLGGTATTTDVVRLVAEAVQSGATVVQMAPA
jgi:3-isopropylmalate dehydrogenase